MFTNWLQFMKELHKDDEHWEIVHKENGLTRLSKKLHPVLTDHYIWKEELFQKAKSEIVENNLELLSYTYKQNEQQNPANATPEFLFRDHENTVYQWWFFRSRISDELCVSTSFFQWNEDNKEWYILFEDDFSPSQIDIFEKTKKYSLLFIKSIDLIRLDLLTSELGIKIV
jgi:hypothetical protein